MNFTGDEGVYINQANASKKTKNHDSHGKRFPKDAKAHYFGKNKINEIFKQEGCVGIRMYHGLHEDGSRGLIMVGVLADGNDIVTKSIGKGDGDGLILESDLPCPSHCPPNGTL
jgi:hypothetical protein